MRLLLWIEIKSFFQYQINMKRTFAMVGLLYVAGMGAAELTGLRVEGLVCPKGVESEAPRFSWFYRAQDDDARGFEQREYRIWVSTDSAALAAGRKADMWDSGACPGSAMATVYGGAPLESRKIYYWKVKTVGNDGKCYESGISTFEQGLLLDSDWCDAQWIGMRQKMSGSIPRNAERWTDYTLSCDVCVESGCANLYFRSLYATDLRYELQIEPGRVGRVTLFFNKWNTRTRLASYRIETGIAENRYYPVEVTCRGNEIRVVFDGKPLGSGPVVDGSRLSGSVGVGAIKDNGDYGRARFDNFRVGNGERLLFADAFDVEGIVNFQDQLFYGGSSCRVEDGTLVVSGLASMIDDKRGIGAPLLRKEFAARKPVVRARAYVAGAGYFEMTLNGRKVTDAWLESGYSRYDKTLYYSIYDITSYVQSRNAVGFELGRGWYGMTTPTLWGEFRSDAWMGEPRVKAVIYLEYADGTEETVVTDETFGAHEGPVIFDSLKAGEYFDSRRREEGWNRVGYDASAWTKAQVCESPQRPGVKLLSQMFEPVRVVERVKPVSVTRVGDDVFWLDFGRHMAGTVSCRVSGNRGDVVRLQYAERLEADSLPSMWRFAPAATGCYQQDVFILGGGDEALCAKFSYKGFRYVMVYGLESIPDMDDFTALVINSDMERVGDFHCSSELWNRISEASVRSIQSNMHSVPSDCPTFEKLGWTCDDAAPMEAMMYYFNIDNLYEKRMLDYADDMDENGVVSDVLPSTWGLKDSDPAWNGSYVAVVWKHYLYYGGAEVLKIHYPRLKSYVNHLSQTATNYILTINEDKGYGDWCPPDHKGGRGPEGLSLYHTVYYYWYVTLMERMASILGETSDAACYRELGAAIKSAFNARYFDYEECAYYFPGRVGGYRQAAQVLPLYFAMEPEGYGQRIADRLARDIAARNNHLWVGILGFEFIADVLMDYGYTDLAYDIHLQDDFPSVGNMIREGATTLWESYSLATTRSLNHKIYAPISEWFFRRVAGLGVDEEYPGFGRVIFAPSPCPDKMDSVDCRYRSVAGEYRAGWRVGREGMEYTLVVPPNGEARVVLPCPAKSTVSESGEPVVETDGSKERSGSIDRVQAAAGVVEFCVKSGSYTFQVKQ